MKWYIVGNKQHSTGNELDCTSPGTQQCCDEGWELERVSMANLVCDTKIEWPTSDKAKVQMLTLSIKCVKLMLELIEVEYGSFTPIILSSTGGGVHQL